MCLPAIPNTEGQISRAMDTLSIEHDQITEEIKSFEQFKYRVLNINTNTEPRNSVDEFNPQRKSTAEGTSKIRTAYRDTVMSTSHYDSEYGDTYMSSINEEFGSDIATALTESSKLTPMLESILISQIENVIESRNQLQKTTRLEQDSIKSAHSELIDLRNLHNKHNRYELSQLNYDQLIEYENKTSNNLDSLDSIAAVRQQDIRKIEKSMRVSRSDLDIHSYLYQSLSTTYPVLETIGQLGRKYKKLNLKISKEILL